MKRRTFVLGAGLTAGAGAVAFGTGAFSSLESERDVVVDVAGDGDAFLELAPVSGPAGNGEYVTETSGGELALTLSEENEDVRGDGLNPRATTIIADVFTVRNQGTAAIELRVDPLIFPGENLALGIIPQETDPTSPVALPVGTEQVFGIAAAVFESITPPSISDTFTVHAEVSE